MIVLDEIYPFEIDGVRHDSACELLRARAFPEEVLACTCTARWDTNPVRDLARDDRARMVERERIACMVERLDNTMMDQAKLAAYIRGQETP